MTKNKAEVTAIIVTYRSRATVGDTLDALYEAHCAGFAEVVVVDNASRDGTVGFIARNYPWVSVVSNDENVGFGRGVNSGFENIASPYTLILNPDAVIDFLALQTLVEFMAMRKEVGIAAPAIIEGATSIQSAGLMTTPSSLLRGALGCSSPMRYRRPIVPGASPFRTSWVCGAVMLVRSDLFKQLGGFDPRYFLYFEETDLCRRAARWGAEIWAVGKAVSRHVGGASAKSTGQYLESSCIADHYYASRFYYLVEHFGWPLALASELFVRVLYICRYLKDNLTGRRQLCLNDIARALRFRLPPRTGNAS